MENHSEIFGESKREIKVGDTVFLTDKGIRTLLVNGHTYKDFKVDDPLKIVEIRDYNKKEKTYMVKMPETDTIVGFGRDEIDFSSEIEENL